MLLIADGCERWLADDYGERRRGCRTTHGGVPIGWEDDLMLSIVTRVCFVYGFCLI